MNPNQEYLYILYEYFFNILFYNNFNFKKNYNYNFNRSMYLRFTYTEFIIFILSI